jgi:hypothetical protein
MQAFSCARAGALRASAILSSCLVSIDAMAEPLVWGSGSWGDTWLSAVAVPSLSPPALWLLAAALAASVGIAARRRS